MSVPIVDTGLVDLVVAGATEPTTKNDLQKTIDSIFKRMHEYVQENADLKLQIVRLEVQLQGERERADSWKRAYEGKFTNAESNSKHD